MRFPLKELQESMPFSRKSWKSGYIQYDGKNINMLKTKKTVWIASAEDLFADDWSITLALERKNEI